MELDKMTESMEFVMPKVEVIYAGRLDIGQEGPHQIESSLKTDEAVVEYGEKIQSHIVRVNDQHANTAVCIDGRGCRCLASDVHGGQMPEYIKPPIRAKMEGGLVNAMTDAALIAGWSLLGEDELGDYDKARTKVESFLVREGYIDAAHTADTSLDSSETTECGAWMKKDMAMKTSVEEFKKRTDAGSISAIDTAVGAYSGMSAEAIVQGVVNGSDSADKIARNKRHYEQLMNTMQLVSESGGFRFNAVAARDTIREKDPEALEVLFSDPNHPTHNHKEPVLVIIDTEDPNITVDRDAMYEIDGFAPFVDNRNKRRQLANIMGGTDEEKERLLMAGDIATVSVGNVLFAPGMPVLVIK